MQYGVDTTFQFYLNSYKTKESMIKAASNMQQKQGLETNTFNAIDFARYSMILSEQPHLQYVIYCY